MALKSNIRHTEGSLAEPMEPTEVTIKATLEDASGLMFFHQSVFDLQDEDGKSVVSCTCGAGVGSDLVVFDFIDSKGAKRRAGIHLANVAAQLIETADPDADKQILGALRR